MFRSDLIVPAAMRMCSPRSVSDRPLNPHQLRTPIYHPPPLGLQALHGRSQGLPPDRFIDPRSPRSQPHRWCALRPIDASRQLISKASIGIEVTTGPLGQGIANAVGLAMAQAHLGAVYNRDGFDLVDNYTYGELATICWLGFD